MNYFSLLCYILDIVLLVWVSFVMYYDYKHKCFTVKDVWLFIVVILFNLQDFVVDMSFNGLILISFIVYWFARILGWIYKSLTKDEKDYQAFLAWF